MLLGNPNLGMMKKSDGGVWVPGFASSVFPNTDPPYGLCAMSETRIAFVPPGEDKIKAYDFGTDWTLTGSGLSIPNNGLAKLARMSANRVAYLDDYLRTLRAYDFNGSAWSLVGSAFSVSGINRGLGIQQGLAALSSTRVAVLTSGTGTLYAFDFNGSAWSQVGTGLQVTTFANAPVKLCYLSPNTVAYIGTNNSLRAYQFNGSVWSLVGTGLSLVSAGEIGYLSDSNIVMCNYDPTVTKKYMYLYGFNGSAWTQKNDPTTTVPNKEGLQLATLSATKLVSYDANLGKLTFYNLM